MSLLIGQPHLQYCEKCGWKNNNIIKSDCLFISKCPKCGSELSLKAVSDLSIFERMLLELSNFKNK